MQVELDVVHSCPSGDVYQAFRGARCSVGELGKEMKTWLPSA